jgi:phosphatase NudJ
MVQEKKHGQTWYIPAGRVDSGEDLIAAAKRETFEEAGVHVTIDGVVRIEHLPMQDGRARLRVIFVGSCVDENEELGGEDSLQAKWVSLEDLESLPLRGRDALELFQYLAAGGPAYPPHVIAREGTPYFLTEQE